MDLKSMSPVSVLLAVGTVAGSATAIATWWPSVGWVTPTQAERAHADLGNVTAADSQKILDAIEGLGLKVDANHMAWLCDEDHEELLELLEKQERGEATVEDRERIRKLRENLDNRTCGD